MTSCRPSRTSTSSNDAFPYAAARYLNVGESTPSGRSGSRTRASSAGSSTGRSRWASARGTCSGRRAGSTGSSRSGGAFDSLRLEKGYRLWGQDLHTEHDPFEAGLGFRGPDGRGGVPGPRRSGGSLDEGPTEKLACLTLDDPTDVVMGKEPMSTTAASSPTSRARVRLLDRTRDRLRLSPGRARGGGHAVRGGILRRPSGGHRRPSRCGIPRASACGHEDDRGGAHDDGSERGPGHPALHEDPEVAVLLRVAEARRRPVQRLQPRTTRATTVIPVAEYWHLVNAVTLWDVGVEKQIQIGPGRVRPHEHDRPSRPAQMRRGRVQVRLHHGSRRRDPERSVLLRVEEDEFWLSLADSDVNLYALGIAAARGWTSPCRRSTSRRSRSRAPTRRRSSSSSSATRCSTSLLRPDEGRARRDAGRRLAHGLRARSVRNLPHDASQHGVQLWGRVLQAGEPHDLRVMARATSAGSRAGSCGLRRGHVVREQPLRGRLSLHVDGGPRAGGRLHGQGSPEADRGRGRDAEARGCRHRRRTARDVHRLRDARLLPGLGRWERGGARDLRLLFAADGEEHRPRDAPDRARTELGTSIEVETPKGKVSATVVQMPHWDPSKEIPKG